MGTLKEDFKAAGHNSYWMNGDRNNSFILNVSYTAGGSSAYMTHDFAARILLTRTGDSAGGISVTPFSALDRETLEFFREVLIEKGGKPPALPEAPDTLTRSKLKKNDYGNT